MIIDDSLYTMGLSIGDTQKKSVDSKSVYSPFKMDLKGKRISMFNNITIHKKNNQLFQEFSRILIKGDYSISFFFE